MIPFTILLLTLSFSFVYGQVQTVKPWLGIAIDEGVKGVLVKVSLPGTPAMKAGIKNNDEIMSIDGIKIKTPSELVMNIASKGVGNTVTVELLRGKKILIKKIALVAKPELLEIAKKNLLNKKTPDFTAIKIQKKKTTDFAIKDQLGRVTLIEFWATWCPSCVASHPMLIDFANKFKNKIDIIAITGEELPVVKRYINKINTILKTEENPILFLQSPKSAVNSLFYATNIPMFVLIDQKGIVRNLVVGAGKPLLKILKEASLLVK